MPNMKNSKGVSERNINTFKVFLSKTDKDDTAQRQRGMDVCQGLWFGELRRWAALDAQQKNLHHGKDLDSESSHYSANCTNT
jgi:hypothetical protein